MMWEFIKFFRDGIAQITDMLDDFDFVIAGMTVSIFDLLFGLIAMSMIISIFWKGIRG